MKIKTRLLKITIGLVLIVLLGLVIERFVFDDRQITSFQGGLANDRGCKPDQSPEFKGAFTDLSKILFIHPLGSTQVDSIGSSYVVIKDNEEAPIYNPTDAVLETIVYSKRPGTGKEGEYGLYFRTSCEVSYFFGRLDKVSDQIRALAPKEPIETAQKDKGVQSDLLIKQGELLGYSSGTHEDRAFEFLLLNESKPVTYINSKRWKQEQSNFAQCPYDYFDTRNDNNLKRYYSGKVISVNENIVAKVFNKDQVMKSVNCGDLSHDIAGSVSGGWFKGTSTDMTGDYLSINKYLSTVQVTARQGGQLKSILTDYSPVVVPAEVKVNGSTCYHDANQNKWAWVKLVSDSQLDMVQGSGKCPDSFPQQLPSSWER